MLRKLLLASTILLQAVADAQTPTLPQDITALNSYIGQLQNLPKVGQKNLSSIIVELQAVSKNLALLVPPPQPPSACIGTPIVPPVVGAILLPPVVPQPELAVSSEIVGVKLQN